MSESFVETVPFESKYAWILANAEAVRGSGVMHRVPTDVIIDLGQLECAKILDRPTSCTPYDPNNPDVVPDVTKVETWALVKSAVIPPLPYPETFGGVIKEQNERWISVSADLEVVYTEGALASWELKWNSESVSELTPDDFLLILAKETIQDNAKQEYVKAYDGSGNFVGFGKYEDRTKVDRNIWKEQYVMKTLGLPLYLKPKAYVPETKTSTFKFTEDDEEKSITVTLPGADKIIYKDDVGSGDESSRAGSKDTEACCRCYTINAIVKPYIHVLDTPLQAKLSANRPSDDIVYPTGTSPPWQNWMSLFYNFFISDIKIPEKENVWNAVNTCSAVTGISIDGTEAQLGALRSLLGTSNVTVTGTPPKISITFPATVTGYTGTIVLHLAFLFKIDIMKMDIFVNDALISHLYCSEIAEQLAPPGGPPGAVKSVWIESVNEGQ